MNKTELITKIADLIIKGGILTTIAYGVKKLSTPAKKEPETAMTTLTETDFDESSEVED